LYTFPLRFEQKAKKLLKHDIMGALSDIELANINPQKYYTNIFWKGLHQPYIHPLILWLKKHIEGNNNPHTHANYISTIMYFSPGNFHVGHDSFRIFSFATFSRKMVFREPKSSYNTLIHSLVLYLSWKVA
jgi:hypothetical protein